MMLNYLDFDYSEDAEGVGTFEAVACVWPEQVSSVQLGPPGKPRHTMTLTLNGTQAFCAAFRARLDLAD